MSLGHSYVPKIRITPPAGVATTYDLSGYQWPTVTQPVYIPVHNSKETVTRSVRQTRYGYRVQVQLAFEMPSPSTDETQLAEQILTVAEDDAYLLELTLDGGAASPTWRACLLEEFTQEPLAGKNIGVAVSMLLTCVDLLPNKPALGSGSW